MKNKKNNQVQEPQVTYGRSNEPLSFEKVWLMFQETDKKFKESERFLTEKFQETDKQFQETNRQFKETDKKFQETERMLNEKFKETDKRIKELSGLFTTQWGKLVESLVAPSCLRLFRERGIGVTQSSRNMVAKRDGKEMECDVILVNNNIVIVVEVKTTFRIEDVNDFLENLKNFKTFFTQYKNYKVLGAVAALKFDSKSDKYAYRNGLFVLRSSGEGIIEIANDEAFCPVDFSAEEGDC